MTSQKPSRMGTRAPAPAVAARPAGARVCHLTSVHPRFDTRIFVKECRSLVARGYAVSLVVADGRGDAQVDGVEIFDVGRPRNRLTRIAVTTRHVLRRAAALDCDLYHLHDPELIPIGLKLRRMGKRVVFDAHEDVPKQLLGKPYLGPRRLRLLAGAYAVFERHACARLDGVVAATPYIGEKFSAINARVVVANNFPLPAELQPPDDAPAKASEVCYVGGIGVNRGIREVVEAMALVRSDAQLNLAGAFPASALKQEMVSHRGWAKVRELGFLDRTGVRGVLGRSVAGLVTLHPLVNYLDALPVKMFEYMAAGVAVIASDFPLWREIVEGHNCGLCVDPRDPRAIAAAIDYFVSHPQEALRMGANGRRAVHAHYNWPVEEARLAAFYERVLED